ncbi:precorrin-3B synthase [Rhizobiaceae bacterium BDR2-2]|uniref:Precorrin-3B synthase n=1 Tax=Ectorhizobium quercum TaxID=2965071 RepID=A0AAE3N1M6_9HYPH|nr:precorrin-3B synthase [Ectorhizobium quercum]MCX8998054.1 precorrin-3B synthase [Ectorhizobium quercum]
MTAILPETMRRGACPSLSAPMQTGDGLLCRAALTAPASPRALVSLCAAALRHGNGILDISARGNLQARGLTPESACLFEHEARTFGLPLRDGIAIDTGPLAGLDAAEEADPRPLAEAIRQGVAERGLAPRLAPKTAVVVDGGGRLPLSALLADIRLRAVKNAGWLLFTGGPERPDAAHGLLTANDAVETALILLSQMAEKGRRFRGRDFGADAVRALAGARLAPARPAPVPAGDPKPFGLFALNDGKTAFGIAPAFGQVRAETLIGFLHAAEAAGIEAIRPAPGHALLLIGAPAACAAMEKAAESAGFLTRADDPRAAIAVCPGQPACTSALFDTHALAAEAARLPRLLDGSFTLHISGCAKGCAHPEPALIALSGQPDGIAFAFDGKAGAPPTASLAIDQAAETLRTLSALVELRREAGETAARCLRRLGPAGIAPALTKGTS